MRFLRSVIIAASLAGVAHAGPSTSTSTSTSTKALPARLLEHYGSKAGYRAVKADVMSWFGTTKNGCVAFLSSALRQIGVEVPRDGIYDGERVSLLTRPLSVYLERELGFRRIDSASALRPGDIAFTENPEYPWHVYVFHSWKDQKRFIANVIDNQGATHPRHLFSAGSHNWTPFAYALRAPGQQ